MLIKDLKVLKKRFRMVNVVLVNERDEPIGLQEKMQAHIDGNLHRAFSVLLFNSKDEMLIHKRASNKYHCPDLWTNACCSHPFEGEKRIDGAKRRLFEELGYEDVELSELFTFTYKARFDNGLTEHEIDTVFKGMTDSNPPKIDPEEIGDYKWVSIEELKHDVAANPNKYTIWFKEILKRI